MQPKGQNGNNRFNDYRVVGQRIWSGQMISTPYGPIPEMLYYPGEVELGYTSDINDYASGQGGNGGLLSDGASFGTAVVGSMTTMIQGSAELTQADALAKNKSSKSSYSF